MNFKKFLSTISAVTIAASAFAGICVTASAVEIAGTKIIDVNFDDGTYGDVKLGQEWTAKASIDDFGGNKVMRVGNTNGYTVTIPDKYLMASSEDIVTIQFDWAWASLSSKHAWFKVTDSNNADIVIFDVNRYNGTYTNETVLGIGRGTTDMPVIGDTSAPSKDLENMDLKTTYTLTFDYANNNVTWNDSRADKTYTKQLPDNVGSIKTFSFGSNYNNVNRRCAIDNIAVYTTVEEQSNDPVATSVQITGADYVLNGKTAEYSAKVVDQFGNPFEDEAVLSLGEDTPAGVTLENGILSVAADAASGTATIVATGAKTGVNSSKAVTIRPATEYNANITAVYGKGDYEKLVDNETIYEDSYYSYYYPKYVQREDGRYSVSQGKLMSDEYYGYATTVKNNVALTVTYDKVTDSNIVYYAEVEDILSDATPATQYAKRYSNGKAIKNAEFDTISLPAGIYSVQLAGRNGSSGSALYTVTGCKETVENVALNSANTCTLSAPGTLHVKSSGNNVEADYIIITKIGEYVAPTIEATKVDTYVGDTDENDVLTLFTAALENVSGTVSKIVIDDVDATDKITEGNNTVLTNADVRLAIIVNRAADTAVVTVQ